MTTCNEYKEAVTAEPAHEDEHVASCAACRDYRDGVRALDRRIAAALAIPVPAPELPELPDIDTANVTSLGRRGIRTSAWLALAATAAFAAVIGYRMIAEPVLQPSLGEQILAHMEHEPNAFANADTPVSDARLARVVPASVATLDHSAGLITYAQSCVINGKSVPHLVIQGRRGPVTILLMPGQEVAGAEEITGESVKGVILPVGRGSIAIVGERDEDLRLIEANLRKSVAWST